MFRFLSAGLICCVCSVGFSQNELPSVPEGFDIEQVAGSPLVEHPMMGGFDDQGRLYLAESAGMNLRADDLLADPPNFIRRLEDTDGDGVFDQSVIFADKMTLPMGALWYRDSLYVASPPYIWRLQDTDDDGVADVREILAGTFGFSGNAASVHGCFLSPDGRIFWCDGRHGHTFENETGQILSQGKAARIFSCRPDGSDLRTFCGGGMDNPVEVDFTETGEVLGTVNILYARPRIDALVHWLPNGVYPREDQGDCVAEFDHTGSLITPITSYGHVAVSGTTRYRSGEFGEEYRDNFFVSIFNTHRIVRSSLKKSGSTWTSENEDFLISENPDFHPTDVIEDADGSLLVIDTGGWFRIGCPTSQIAKPEFKGGIYRIRKSGGHQVEDPRGLQLAVHELSDNALQKLLDDPRYVIREKALDELSQRISSDRSAAIQSIGSKTWKKRSEQFQRNYLWALARATQGESITDEAELTILSSLIQDSPESVKLVAMKVLAQIAPIEAVSDVFLAQLSNTPLDRQRVASRCLEELLSRSPADPDPKLSGEMTQHLLTVLESPQLDRHLEHTVVHTLLKTGDPSVIHRALEHEQPSVRRNALVVLSQRDDTELEATDVFTQLASNDPQLLKESLRVLETHPEWIDETSELLDGWLKAETIPADRVSTLKGFLLATFHRDDVENAVRTTLTRDSTSRSVRNFLLEMLNNVATDQLDGDWSPALSLSLQTDDEETLLLTLHLIGKLGATEFDDRLLAIFEQSHDSQEVASAALSVLAPRLEPIPDSAFNFLLGLMRNQDQTLAALSATETLSHCPTLTPIQQESLTASFADLPSHLLPALQPLVLSANPSMQRDYFAAVLEQNVSDQFSEGDFQHWSTSTFKEEVTTLISKIHTQREKAIGERNSKLAELLTHLSGGDPEQGKRIFYSQKAACSGCHRVETDGGQIGPNLTQIGRIRTERDLLEAIVYPSISFARGYEPYTVVTDSGRSYSGVIQSETAGEIVLVTTDRRTIRISRNEIELLKLSPVSVMPRGIHELLSPDELRDLLAFLKSRQ